MGGPVGEVAGYIRWHIRACVFGRAGPDPGDSGGFCLNDAIRKYIRKDTFFEDNPAAGVVSDCRLEHVAFGFGVGVELSAWAEQLGV